MKFEPLKHSFLFVFMVLISSMEWLYILGELEGSPYMNGMRYGLFEDFKICRNSFALYVVDLICVLAISLLFPSLSFINTFTDHKHVYGGESLIVGLDKRHANFCVLLCKAKKESKKSKHINY